MSEDYNFESNTYAGVRVEDLMAMYEICVKQDVDFNDPKTTAYTAGFKAGVEYVRKEIENNVNSYILKEIEDRVMKEWMKPC